MNKEQIVEIAVAAALDWQKKQQQKQNKFRHDKRLRNTRLLLRHYPLLKEHCDKSVYKNQDNANAIDILDEIERYEDEEYIEAIKRSVARTQIIIDHIDTMLGIYELYCQKSSSPEDMRRYRALKAKYFLKTDMSVFVSQEGIDERTYYRDVRDAVSKIGSLIFGIDSLMDIS